jgi:hypothetical protein
MNARRYHGQLRVPVGPQSSGFFPLNSGATLHNLPSQRSSVSSCSVDFIRCPCKEHSPRWCQCGAVSADEEFKNSMTVQDPSIFIGWPETLLLWKNCQMRNQATLRSGKLRFYFTPVVPDELILKIQGPEQWIHRFLKEKCKASGYEECVRVNRWASAELETRGCLDKSHRGDLL